MTVNTALLEQTISFIEKYPMLHDQRNWAKVKVAAPVVKKLGPDLPPIDCGTSACFAGWATQFAGHKFEFFGERRYRGETAWRTDEGLDIEISALADLGISKRDAGKLFHPGNSADELRDMVDELTEVGHLDDYTHATNTSYATDNFWLESYR